MEVIVASSSIDGGIGCWDSRTGDEKLRYKSCASPPHGLVCVGQRFLASSQLRNSSATSGSVLYWDWSKPQVGVKSFPAEQIKPLAANYEGTYIVGGGLSGDIYLWEVVSGTLLKKWNAHYRAVTCLMFIDDGSMVISGSEDGSIKISSLIPLFGERMRPESTHSYEHTFSDHTLAVTDIALGFGGWNAIIVSASEDRTCKVWSFATGKLLRNVVFPSVIEAVALDPAERFFYAGARDGKIYIAALNMQSPPSTNFGPHIISCFSNHSKAVTCLKFATNGNYLISGSEDGMVRVWDARTHNIVRVLRHAKGPVNNILVVKQPTYNNQASSKRHVALSPPLEKYGNTEGPPVTKTVLGLQGPSNTNSEKPMYMSTIVLERQIKELEQQGSAAAKMEMDKLKHDYKKSTESVQQWKKMYENLHEFCVNELLEEDGKDAPGSSQ